MNFNCKYFEKSIDCDELEKAISQFDLEKTINEHREFLKKSSFKDTDNFGLYANGWVICLL